MKLLTLIIILVSCSKLYGQVSYNYDYSTNRVILNNSRTLTISQSKLFVEVDYYLSYYKLEYPEVVMSQVLQETGWFSNTHHNNLLGLMRNGKKIPFSNIEQCIKFYKLWQVKYIRTKAIDNRKEYITKLVGYYAEDESYDDKLLRFIQIYKL